MNEEKDLPTGKGEEFDSDPDTNTDDQPEAAPPSFPAPEPARRDEPTPSEPAVEAPPAVPAGPRVFPEHYLLLLGSAMVLAATLSVWRRQGVFGYTLTGAMSIKRTFLMGLAIYGIAVGISNIATGRLRGMFMSFVLGVAALWLGIKEFLAFNDEAIKPGFLGWTEMENWLKAHGGSNFQILSERWFGQWGPGVWMSTIGGAIIVFVFLKAIFVGGKKKDAAPPPPQRRRGRR